MDCSLREVDFANADLSKADFHESNLEGAYFENTILERSDFRNALNYRFDPESNYIRGAKFSQPQVLALLAKHDIDIE